MTKHLPDYYFRPRDGGAAVFRVESDPRTRRLDLREIAVVVVKSGNIKPHGDRVLTAQDRGAIADWLAARQAELRAREVDDFLRLIDQMGQSTHWLNSRADWGDVAPHVDRVLLAMQDMRAILLRRTSDALGGPQERGTDPA